MAAALQAPEFVQSEGRARSTPNDRPQMFEITNPSVIKSVRNDGVDDGENKLLHVVGRRSDSRQYAETEPEIGVITNPPERKRKLLYNSAIVTFSVTRFLWELAVCVDIPSVH